MHDSSTSSVWEASNEWKAKADEALQATMTELSRKTAPVRRIEPSTVATTFAPSKSTEDEAKQRQQWAKTQISDINNTARNELESLEALRGQQQEVYEREVAEKNEVWEKLVLQRKEEAAELRSMIANLSAAISTARNQAKLDIDEAKRKAAGSTQTLREQREKQLQQIAELTQTLETDRKQFEINMSQMQSSNNNTVAQKKDQIARLQATLASLRMKIAEKQKQNETKFKQQVKTIRDLRSELQKVREEENAKQNSLMSMRKLCASVSKKISARKDEAASLKRQLVMLQRDNEELQGEIVKMETSLFPNAFNPPKL